MHSVHSFLKKALGLAAIAIGLTIGAASATPVDTSPITSDYYIEHDGLLWAWASPVSDENFSSNVLSLPGIQDGWRFATDAEWALRPTVDAYGDKCASRFWNSVYSHCDFSDGASGSWTNEWGHDYYDLIYVSGNAAPTPDNVPAPAGLALLGLGLVGLGLARRKR